MIEVFMLRKILLNVIYYPRYFLCVLCNTAQLFLVKIWRNLLAQQDLTDDVAKVGRTGAIFCIIIKLNVKLT